jgi:hypothetical protein
LFENFPENDIVFYRSTQSFLTFHFSFFVYFLFHLISAAIFSPKMNPAARQRVGKLHPNAYDQATKNEQSRDKFIHNELPEYFGVKAKKQQMSIIKGRNPKSLPTDDELWHYSRVSNERHKQVRGGKGFWKTLNDSASSQKIRHTSSRDTADSHKDDDSTQDHAMPLPVFSPGAKTAMLGSRPGTAQTNVSSVDPSLFKASSLQAQLKNLSNSANDLKLKVDFLHRSLIHYNMTCIIMNYNEEVIYLDKYNELRVKPLSEVKNGDRVKFKVTDVNNPSNPSTIKFGDSLWLQASDNVENPLIDTTFQNGNIITTKLFTPTEVAGIGYEQQFQSHNKKLLESAHRRKLNQVRIDDFKNEVLDPNYVSPTKSYSFYTNLQKELPSNSLLSTSKDGDLDGITVGTPGKLEEDNSIASFCSQEDLLPFATPGGNDTTPALAMGSSSSTASSRPFTAPSGGGGSSSNYYNNRKDRKERQEEYSKQVRICGHTELIRIIDPKKMEQISDTTLLSDDKASRYVSRNAIHLGKWTIETAVRMNDTQRIKEFFFANIMNKTTGKVETDSFDDLILNFKNNDPEALKEFIRTHLLSLTPIMIQQDQYCLSTASYQEYQQWPLNSSHIIHESNLLSNAQKDDYEEKFNIFLNNQVRFDVLGLGRENIMKSKRQASKSQHYRMLLEQQQEKKKNELKESQRESSQTGFGGSSSKTVSFGGRPSSPSNMSDSNGGIAFFDKGKQINVPFFPEGGSTATDKNKPVDPTNRDGYVCLRRVIKRPAPYEFAVDRRCVWKLCLYEQFSDNYLQTEREKEVKRVMETATMVLKLSKMNREGARVHIASNHDENLPELVSGETFPQKLREITFKLQQRKNQEYLMKRRMNESHIEEYFQSKISTVLEEESTGFEKSKHSLRQVHAEKSMDSSSFSHFLNNLEEVKGENEFSHPNVLTSRFYRPGYGSDNDSVEGDLDGGAQESPMLIAHLKRSDSQIGIRGFPSYKPPKSPKKPSTAGSSSPSSSPAPSKISFFNSPSNAKTSPKKSKPSSTTTTNPADSVPMIQLPAPTSEKFQKIYKNPLEDANGTFTLLNPSLSISYDNQALHGISVFPSTTGTTVPLGSTSSDHHHQQQRNQLQINPNFAFNDPSKTLPMSPSSILKKPSPAGSPKRPRTAASVGFFGGRDSKTSSYRSEKEKSNNNYDFSKVSSSVPELSLRPRSVGGGGHHYSDAIQKVFNTTIVPPYEKRLILNSTTALHEFDELTDGEQLLAYHKTFRHINRAAKVREKN